LARVHVRTNAARLATRRRNAPICSSGTHTDTSIPAHNNLASVRASKLSDFTLAWEIARTSEALATTTSATCG
jgi:hypothetical protein